MMLLPQVEKTLETLEQQLHEPPSFTLKETK